MKARYRFTKIDALGPFVGRKAPVDIVAVVHAVGELGTVKRNSDGSEFERRCAFRLCIVCRVMACQCVEMVSRGCTATL